MNNETHCSKLCAGRSCVWSALASFALVAVAAPAFAGLPSGDNAIQLSNVSFEQGLSSRDVVVNYTLSGTNAFIRCDILTNGVSIGELNLNTFTGDYSDTTAKLISPGSRSFTWKARKDWPDHLATDVQVLLQAYYREEPEFVSKTYLVVDLSNGKTATSYDYTYLDAVPSGGWTSDHKVSKLVMRRIPAGAFVMGSPATEANRVNTGVEDQHTVQITKPFYIGVFELTQGQFDRIVNIANLSAASYFYGEHPEWAKGDMPVCGVNFADLTSTCKIADNLSARTGLKFGYPTSAQWEYACRAGSTTSFPASASCPSGFAYAENTDTYNKVMKIGNTSASNNGKPMVVGSYECNAWGLYDMIGNMLEPTLDWWSVDFQYRGKDPTGPATGTYRDGRGGSHAHQVYQSRTTQHNAYPNTGARAYYYGCRLAILP